MSYSPYNFSTPINQQPPSGNVYLVNNLTDVANVPYGFGTTINLCLNENLMYLRNNQNVMAYKLTPYEPPKPNTQQNNQIDERLSNVEKQLKQVLEFLNANSTQQPTKQEAATSRTWDV